MGNNVVINEKDNVAISLDGVDVKVGHKLATKDIAKGEFVFKYGNIIGVATQDIKKGEWIHSHNLVTHLNEQITYSYNPEVLTKNISEGSFMGYKREKGRAGVRNDIYIIPTVGCVNSVAKQIEKESQKFVKGSIDSIFALTHQFGCSQIGEDHQNIKNLLASIALNPNASFVLFVGLGCENNQISAIKEVLAPYGRTNIEFFNCQEVEDEVNYGVNIIKKFSDIASKFKREKCPMSDLCVGLKCGGSDGFSGITANPTVGKVSDKIISLGGSTILTEVPEMFGAEQILMNKCENAEIFEKYRELVVNFKNYYLNLGFPIYENPSPGNKEGGITTLEEKSLGCITKAGNSNIVDVLNYCELIKKPGLNVLDAPGNDLIASTALAASGCQIIMFTTGRGTPFSTVVPTLKISTNDRIANAKKGWIDFNAYGMDDSALFDLVMKTANGEYKAKQEDSHEIAFFKKGVTL